MSDPDRTEAAAPKPTTAVPVTPVSQAETRVAGEARSFRAEPPPYTFIEEHRAPAPRDEDRVSRR